MPRNRAVPLYLDKILSQLAYPLGSAVLATMLGLLLLLLHRRRLGAMLIFLAVAWVTTWSLPATSDPLRAGLEQLHPNLPAADYPRADVIILLGGGMRGPPPDWPYPDLGASADRVWHAARLYHAGRAPLIIASGGAMGWTGERMTEACAMRALLLDLGVPDEAIILEDQSRSTRENAVYSQRVMEEQAMDSALLVTSALHMHRSMATFRAVGLDPIPAATDFEVLPEPNHPLRWLPDAEALHDSTRALKEYLGLAVYRLRGWAE